MIIHISIDLETQHRVAYAEDITPFVTYAEDSHGWENYLQRENVVIGDQINIWAADGSLSNPATPVLTFGRKKKLPWPLSSAV